MAALASRQYGVVSRHQLTRLGLGRGAIERRLAIGRLHRIHPGVYAVGHTALPPRGRLMAAVLACGAGAVLSHRSAADLWGLRRTSRPGADVTVPGRSRRGLPGIDLHLVRRLAPEDCTVLHGIPVTTVARTLLDLAEAVPRRELERAFEEAERLRLFDLRAVEEVCGRARGRHGLRPLRALLAAAAPLPPATRSELESRFLRLCRETGLPQPAVNLWIADHEVDMAWPEQRLIVELDGHAFHGTRAAFERDRIRDADLQLAGYRVLRVTHRRLEREPEAVIEAVRLLLES